MENVVGTVYISGCEVGLLNKLMPNQGMISLFKELILELNQGMISLLKELILHLNQGMLAPPLLGQILIREDQGLHKQYTLWQM
ncbi:unnamed protein product [Brassica napus]|uniref:(rape) hypothetical protein n=1 Tax=Brassica napus TaxID=3708 RepID=A0A816ZSP6_BRANA|nr:unnamed protein product [Brassica napus]